ncbi:hypothetical protein DL98DRAFT_647273 [Cadophora sp. DSE1049]|nr:hypothetical protein DL98DRAFT_647273 [Cadophora sp. DSE1049]
MTNRHLIHVAKTVLSNQEKRIQIEREQCVNAIRSHKSPRYRNTAVDEEELERNEKSESQNQRLITKTKGPSKRFSSRSTRSNIKQANTESTIIPPTSPKHAHTFIFLHDWNSHGNDFAKSFLINTKSRTNETLAEIFPTMRFVFPTARLAYSYRRLKDFTHSSYAGVLQGQGVIPQWFDVWDITRQYTKEEKEVVLPGLRDSICDIAEIIMSEANIVGIENIVIGGVTSAFVGWGGWLPFRDEIEGVAGECFDDRVKIQSQVGRILGMDDGEDEDYEELEEEVEEDGEECVNDVWNESSLKEKSKKPVAKTPILVGHVEDDEMVPYQLGRDMGRTLSSLGFKGHWQKYKGGHGIDQGRRVDDMADFLGAVLDIEG